MAAATCAAPSAAHSSLATGSPGAGYPWHWAVYRWLAGNNAVYAPLANLSAEARDVFRAVLPIDDATWARGWGWALSAWVGGVAFYQHTHPAFGEMAQYTIAEVLADYEHGG